MADTILVTTRDLEHAVPLRDAFRDAGYAVELLTAGEKIADVEDPVLLVLTGSLDEKQARRLGREAAERDHLPVIALFDRAEDDRPEVRRALAVHEAFVKPADPEDIALVGHRLVERRRLREITGIIGETDAMIEVLERVVQIAPVAATVLLTGESGTGKERVARGLHALSPRRHRPFIAANVAALSETLIESELFGHEKGSFTGAIGQRKGFFELANRGTLFLDEIGEIPMSTQTKLLRVLEEREFMRLGGEEPISVDVRFIAATNQDLRQLVSLGRFRRDLYYRLNVLSIRLPPLRDRREDVPLLIEHFVRQAAEENDRPGVTVSPETMDILKGYDWPGNVRELRNLVESMVVLSPGGVIRPDDLPREVRPGTQRVPLPAAIPPATRSDGGAVAGPELEFIFRTLLQLRIDVEELRRRFDEYRETHPELIRTGYPWQLPRATEIVHGGQSIADVDAAEPTDVEPADTDEDAEEDVVVYRSGMTLRDLEKAAITAALREVKGNRRRAAEMLAMGERTLYRKIKEYDIPL
jgi:DNA-binding NtrC family response regulator